MTQKRHCVICYPAKCFETKVSGNSMQLLIGPFQIYDCVFNIIAQVCVCVHMGTNVYLLIRSTDAEVSIWLQLEVNNVCIILRAVSN